MMLDLITASGFRFTRLLFFQVSQAGKEEFFYVVQK
jgi:hypothetical protein